MSAETLTEFDKQYLATWTEPDPDRRRALIDELWAPDGRMVISALGTTIEGAENIAAHVTHVYDEQIAKNGVRFTYDQHIEAGDALLLRWSIVAPNDQVVNRGADLLFRDADGLVTTVYMFMGVE